MINIYTLNNNRDLRIKKRFEYFSEIFGKCCNRIKSVSKNRDYCFFRIPQIVIGIPIFNVKNCCDYIYEILVNKGFKVSQIHNDHLLIYWGHVPSYISNPNMENSKKYRLDLIEHEPKSKSQNTKFNKIQNKLFRDINDSDNHTENFIYDLPELNNKLKNVL